MSKDRGYMKLVAEGEASKAKAPPATAAAGSAVSNVGPPPEYVRASAEAEAVWHELAQLHGNALSPADATLFAQLVIAEQLYRNATKEVARVGTLIKSPTGYPIQNPYLAVLNKQQERIIGISKELGITPLARGRVKPGKNRAARSNPFQGLRSLDD